MPSIGCRACLYAHRMPDRAAAELQDDVLAEQVEQLVHLAGMDAPGGHRHQLVEARPMLVEEYAMLELGRIEILPADVIVAARRIWIALQLADDRPRVNMIDAGKSHPLGDDAERYAMCPLTRVS